VLGILFWPFGMFRGMVTHGALPGCVRGSGADILQLAGRGGSECDHP
jgi:hypothetical protein